MSDKFKLSEEEAQELTQLIWGGKLQATRLIDRIESIIQDRGNSIQDGWIGVEDRLPDVDGRKGSDRVFAIWDHNGKTTIEIMAYCFIEDGDGYYAWCNCYGDIYGDPENDDQYNITHWQPLPSAPKQPKK